VRVGLFRGEPADATAPRAFFVQRAVFVLVTWAFSALPAAFGLLHCPSATLFHAACPGCGMTRAMHMLIAGDVTGSLHIHPLAAPCAASFALFGLATAWTTYAFGTPIRVLELRVGRWAAALLVLVQAALVVLWLARRFGMFGGLPEV
jgi:hypothetical protein